MKRAARVPKVGRNGHWIDPYYFSKEWGRLRGAVLDRDHFRCHYCGKKAMQADHVIPRSKGGADAIHNRVACCPKCNKIASGTLFGSLGAKTRWIRSQK